MDQSALWPNLKAFGRSLDAEVACILDAALSPQLPASAQSDGAQAVLLALQQRVNAIRVEADSRLDETDPASFRSALSAMEQMNEQSTQILAAAEAALMPYGLPDMGSENQSAQEQKGALPTPWRLFTLAPAAL